MAADFINIEKIKSFLGKNLQIEIVNIDDLFDKVQECFKLKDNEKAIEYCNKIIDINPNEGDAYSERGFAKFKQRDFVSAISDIKKAIELNCNNIDLAYYNLGEIYKELKDYENAIHAYDEAIENANNYMLEIYKNARIESIAECGKSNQDNTLD